MTLQTCFQQYNVGMLKGDLEAIPEWQYPAAVFWQGFLDCLRDKGYTYEEACEVMKGQLAQALVNYPNVVSYDEVKLQKAQRCGDVCERIRLCAYGIANDFVPKK